ncbi:hypothetical protein EV426DRAFT_607088 [Tirmania nivea]|nr:hypothetical protein EV426DRAFT_607088 [Tirmania nivea]
MGMLSEGGNSVVHMTNTSDDGYIGCELDTSAMALLTLEDGPEAGEYTEMVDSISSPEHDPTAIFSSGPNNGQSHPSPVSGRFSPLGGVSALSTSSGWVTTPGSTLTFISTPSPIFQSLTTSFVEMGSAKPSLGPRLGVTPDANSRPSLSTNHTDNTLAYVSNELHPVFGSSILTMTPTLKKRPRPRYVPKLQPAEDVFLTKNVAHAKRLRQNYILEAPRLRGYRGCKARCCSCRLRIEDFEKSPTAKKFKFTHMSDARVACSRRHDYQGFNRVVVSSEVQGNAYSCSLHNYC